MGEIANLLGKILILMQQVYPSIHFPILKAYTTFGRDGHERQATVFGRDGIIGVARHLLWDLVRCMHVGGYFVAGLVMAVLMNR